MNRTRRSNARGSWVAGGGPQPQQQGMMMQQQEHVEEAYMEQEQYDDSMMKEEGVGMAAGEQVAAAPKPKPHWMKLGPDGKRLKHKPNPKKRNAMLRKAVQPRTALMCLNELQTGLKFDVEPVGIGQMGQYGASVMVKDQIYKGYGSCKNSAKQAAAESALMSFVKPPLAKGEEGTEEDETPWRSIASFAMYKLFAEWSEGKVGMTAPVQNTNYSDMRDYINAAPRQMEAQQQNESLKQHLQPRVKGGNGANLQPAKNMKEEFKVTNHPVMIVHQLVPDIKYDVMEEMNMDGSNTKTFTLTAYVNAAPYSGQGTSMKKAKFQLCKMVLKEVFDIDNTYEPSA